MISENNKGNGCKLKQWAAVRMDLFNYYRPDSIHSVAGRMMEFALNKHHWGGTSISGMEMTEFFKVWMSLYYVYHNITYIRIFANEYDIMDI